MNKSLESDIISLVAESPFLENTTGVFDKIESYKRQLLEANMSMNLIGSSTIPDFDRRHILDSIQLVKFLQPHDKILDLGSGAGLPAILLSIVTNLPVCMVEKSPLKSGFLQHMIDQIPLKNIFVFNDNIFFTKPNFEPTVVTSRAFKSLHTLCQLTTSLWPNARLLTLKGQDYALEMDLAKKQFDFDALVHPSAVDPNGVTLNISNITVL